MFPAACMLDKQRLNLMNAVGMKLGLCASVWYCRIVLISLTWDFFFIFAQCIAKRYWTKRMECVWFPWRVCKTTGDLVLTEILLLIMIAFNFNLLAFHHECHFITNSLLYWARYLLHACIYLVVECEQPVDVYGCQQKCQPLIIWASP